jgi:hypothetical protein
MHVNVALLMETHPREQRAALVPSTKQWCPAFIKRQDTLPPIFAKAAGVVRPVGHLHWLTDRAAAP